MNGRGQPHYYLDGQHGDAQNTPETMPFRTNFANAPEPRFSYPSRDFDACTVMTGVTSETGRSVDNLKLLDADSSDDDYDPVPKKSGNAANNCCFRTSSKPVSLLLRHNFERYLTTVVIVSLNILCIVSPMLMVLLEHPKVLVLFYYKQTRSDISDEYNSDRSWCRSTLCESDYITLLSKSFILGLLVILLYARKPASSLPRPSPMKIVFLFIATLMTSMFWMYYIIRLWSFLQSELGDLNVGNDSGVSESLRSEAVLNHASSLADCLLYLHLSFVLSAFLRFASAVSGSSAVGVFNAERQVSVKVVRSPDAFEVFYQLNGHCSIQQAAYQIVTSYYRDFPDFNPLLDAVIKRKCSLDALTRKTSITKLNTQSNKQVPLPGSDGYTVYDIDGQKPSAACRQTPDGGNAINGDIREDNDFQGGFNERPASEREVASITGSKNGAGDAKQCHLGPIRMQHVADRYYAEQDYEKKLKKRRIRLVLSVEQAFSQIRRLHHPGGTATVSTLTLALDLLKKFGRPLKKYLRATRQHRMYNRDDVIEWLCWCIDHGLGAQCFLQKFFGGDRACHNGGGSRRKSATPIGFDNPNALQVDECRSTVSWLLGLPAGFKANDSLNDLIAKTGPRVAEKWALRSGKHGKQYSSAKTLLMVSGFVLKRGDVTIAVELAPVPHINILEEQLHERHFRFQPIGGGEFEQSVNGDHDNSVV